MCPGFKSLTRYHFSSLSSAFHFRPGRISACRSSRIRTRTEGASRPHFVDNPDSILGGGDAFVTGEAQVRGPYPAGFSLAIAGVNPGMGDDEYCYSITALPFAARRVAQWGAGVRL